jgi:hypothetical protein
VARQDLDYQESTEGVKSQRNRARVDSGGVASIEKRLVTSRWVGSQRNRGEWTQVAARPSEKRLVRSVMSETFHTQNCDNIARAKIATAAMVATDMQFFSSGNGCNFHCSRGGRCWSQWLPGLPLSRRMSSILTILFHLHHTISVFFYAHFF